MATMYPRHLEKVSENASRSSTFFRQSIPQALEMTPKGILGTGSLSSASARDASLRYPPVHRTCSGHLRPIRRQMSLAALAVSTDSVYESEKRPFIHRTSERASSHSVSGSLISSQILSHTKG